MYFITLFIRIKAAGNDNIVAQLIKPGKEIAFDIMWQLESCNVDECNEQTFDKNDTSKSETCNS